ncbi:hypothetical protein CLF_110632 [Clonorchis sinensis]|uniref:Uncharacterized protein n=1 Tax=Clonorchis sinensis TaxID=79923 RepID=G7YTQ6_CLOSI|nr:hypothetical protein CLF_110632 [Clonorchis sinensis]
MFFDDLDPDRLFGLEGGNECLRKLCNVIGDNAVLCGPMLESQLPNSANRSTITRSIAKDSPVSDERTIVQPNTSKFNSPKRGLPDVLLKRNGEAYNSINLQDDVDISTSVWSFHTPVDCRKALCLLLVFVSRSKRELPIQLRTDSVTSIDDDICKLTVKRGELINDHLINQRTELRLTDETGSIRAAEMRPLQVFDNRCFRTKARVGWYRRIRNETLSKRVFACAPESFLKECPAPETVLGVMVSRRMLNGRHKDGSEDGHVNPPNMSFFDIEPLVARPIVPTTAFIPRLYLCRFPRAKFERILETKPTSVISIGENLSAVASSYHCLSPSPDGSAHRLFTKAF